MHAALRAEGRQVQSFLVSRWEGIAGVILTEAEELPGAEHMRGKRRGHHQPPAIRMGDIDGAAVQMQRVLDGADGSRGGAAIFEIADNGRAEACEMHANLVRA